MANQLNTAPRWYQTPTIFGEEIANSAHFRGQNQYLSMTQYVTGSGKNFNWIFSTWFKLGGDFGTNRTIIGAGNSSSNFTLIRLNYADEIDFRNYSTQYSNNTHDVRLITKRKFLDIHNWYHLIVDYNNTGNPSASDRIKIFINGERITDFGTEMGLNQNEHSYFCLDDTPLHIGSSGYSASNYFNGYLAQTELTPSVNRDQFDYGEFVSGVWTPKRPKPYLSYGSFLLEYKNQTSSGATANDIGAETSGIIDVSGSQATHFTPQGSWGTGNGGLKDTPTNNFPVWNAHTLGNLSTLTLSRGNRSCVHSTSGDWEGITATLMPPKSGNFNSGQLTPSVMAEFYVQDLHSGTSNTSSYWLGIGLASVDYNPENYGGQTGQSIVLFNNGVRYWQGFRGSNNNWRWVEGDIVTVAMTHIGTQKLALWYVNGQYKTGYYFSDTTSIWTFMTSGRANFNVIANFGQDSSFGGLKTRQGYPDKNGQGDFYYDYSADGRNNIALCHKNLQQLDYYDLATEVRFGDPPTKHFKSVKYNGIGSTRSVTFGFKPDFLWVKSDYNYRDHGVWNTVRASTTGENGRNVRINAPDQEINGTASVQSFTNNGITVSNANILNANGRLYHSYSWKAGDALSGTDTNTDGSVQTTVSTNPKTLFSVINYSGTSTTDFNIGHGLGVAPDTFWIKRLTGGTANWRIYHKDLGASNTTHFGQSGAITSSFTGFQNLAPSNVRITLKNDAELGANGSDYLCLAWKSVDGFSKFDSYEGNRSEFVYLGFKPALLIMTNIDSSVRGWYMWSNIQGDNAAVNENLQHYKLNSSTGNDLEDSVDDIRIYSNGFQVLDTTEGNLNTANETIIYWAWAEMPTHFSNAF